MQVGKKGETKEVKNLCKTRKTSKSRWNDVYNIQAFETENEKVPTQNSKPKEMK